MNYTTAVMLINENIRMIKAAYELDDKGEPKQTYNWKTLDQSIKVGDYVVVPTSTRVGYTINKVTEVDVEVDFDSTVQIKWVIDKVNFQASETIIAQESTWIDALKAGERRKHREEVKANLLGSVADGTLAQLGIANVKDITALEAPKPTA